MEIDCLVIYITKIETTQLSLEKKAQANHGTAYNAMLCSLS